MWQWYCRCMCLIMTNGFHVFFRVAGQGSPIRRMQRPERTSSKVRIKNKIHKFTCWLWPLNTSLFTPPLGSDKPKK